MIENLLVLPYDVLLNIIKYLNLRDLRNVMLTCKTLRDIVINDNAMWKLVSENKLILRDRVNRRLEPLTYYNQCKVSYSWCKGMYKNKVFIYHRANYLPWVKLLNHSTIFLSVRSNLSCYTIDSEGYSYFKQFLWSVDVPTVLRNDVRTNDISRFVLKDNIIVCGNRDGSTTIYNYNSRKKPSLLYHIRDCHKNGECEVSAVEFVSSKSNPCIITASSYTSELLLWHWKWRENSCDPIPQVEHHMVNCDTDLNHRIKIGLRSLAVNQSQDKLAIGLNRNSKPILFDINICSLLTQADDTRNANTVVRDIQWHDERAIVFVTHCGKLQLIDIRTNSVVYETTDPFQSPLYCVKTDGDRSIVVGSAEYSRCVLYDIRFKKHVQMYFTQRASSPVYSLDFDSTKLIAAADRGTAALLFNINLSVVPVRDYSPSFEIVRTTR